MNELKQIRKNIGLTQIEAANMIGVSRRTYQKYEENNIFNDAYDEILKALKEIDTFRTEDFILNPKIIKKRCEGVFVNYPEVKCAYLYGSYAREEATVESDVDILVVVDTMGMKFFGLAADLKNVLGKDVDLQTFEQVIGDEKFMRRFLMESIKIYG
ncbi:MAG: nucleotidyltransferase domain-containing protein [Bacilli bacterium]|nr:nucleotidyltransferase domain-containing protein [Bacilli bacterium]